MNPPNIQQLKDTKYVYIKSTTVYVLPPQNRGGGGVPIPMTGEKA